MHSMRDMNPECVGSMPSTLAPVPGALVARWSRAHRRRGASRSDFHRSISRTCQRLRPRICMPGFGNGCLRGRPSATQARIVPGFTPTLRAASSEPSQVRLGPRLPVIADNSAANRSASVRACASALVNSSRRQGRRAAATGSSWGTPSESTFTVHGHEVFALWCRNASRSSWPACDCKERSPVSRFMPHTLQSVIGLVNP